MDKASLPSVFAYNDFRAYLRDYYQLRHEQDSCFSKAAICRQLGLPNSRSYFQDILNGKFLSPVKIPLLITMLGLSKEEANYFRVLVNFNQATADPQERELLFEQLVRLNHTPTRIVEPQLYAYYRQWHHSAVRAVLGVIDFVDDYKQLAKSLAPPLTIRQAKESVALLLSLGLIAKNEEGLHKPTDSVISTGRFAQSELVRQYQQHCLDAAKQVLLANRKQPQRMITKMLSVSAEGYGRIAQKIEQFNAEITSIVHNDGARADRVCQLSIVLVPLSNTHQGNVL
jgi:uncharacterized protein (TIGR02147 family)